MFTKSVQHGLNLLAVMPKVGETESAKALAKKGKVPTAYATKVMQCLCAAGICSSQRGVGGGATLLKPLNKVSVLSVVDAVLGEDKPAKGTSAEKITNDLRKHLAKVMVK
jgi:Rrf2 family protein